MQGVLAVRNLFQYNCLIAGCPGDFLRTSFVAFNRTVFCGYLRQVSISGIGQLHFCARQFLRSVSVLAYLNDRNGRRRVLHDQSVVGFAFFQTNKFFNIAVCIHCKCHFLGLFRKAVRCGDFFQGIVAFRQIGQCYAALFCVGSPCDCVAHNLDFRCTAVTVRTRYLRQICAVRCNQFQFCAIQFIGSVDALLADGNTGLHRIKHGEPICSFVIAVGCASVQLYAVLLHYAILHLKGDFSSQFISVRCLCFLQGVLAVRNLFQYNCLIAGCPGDFLRTSFVAFNRTVFCGYLRQVSISGIGQLHFCARQFLRSVSVLAYLNDRNGRRCVFHNNCHIIRFFQTVHCLNLAFGIDGKGHALGLFRKAVRLDGFFQGVGTCREIGQFYAALCAVRFPADGFVALDNAICRLIAVSCFYLRKIYAVRCNQCQGCAGQFIAAAYSLLANGDRLLCAVLHDDVIAGNVIFLRIGRSLCYLAFVNSKGECSLYLVVAIRGNHFFHGIFTVRQADDIGLCLAV